MVIAFLVSGDVGIQAFFSRVAKREIATTQDFVSDDSVYSGCEPKTKRVTFRLFFRLKANLPLNSAGFIFFW